MLRVKCKRCNTELISSNKVQGCGCTNRMVLEGDTVSAVNLSEVILLNNTIVSKAGHLTENQLEWQEQRRKRKIRKLTYEER